MKDFQFIGYTLLQTTAITSIVSTRVYHGYIPETVTSKPVINYYQLSGPGRGYGMETKTFTINCRATDPAVARDLGDKVVSLFGGAEGMGTYGYSSSFSIARASVVRDNGLILEDESDSYNVPIDVLIVYSRDTVS